MANGAAISASPDASSSSPANSRIVSSIVKRGSPVGLRSGRTRLSSTSDASVSKTSSPLLAADRLGRLESPAAAKTASRAKSVRSSSVRSPWLHSSVARSVRCRSGQVLRDRRRAGRAPVEATAHRLGRQELRACRRQLDRERQAVEPRAHLRDRGGVFVVELELRVDRAGAGGEQAHGVVRRQFLEARARPGLRAESSGGTAILVLPDETERRATRREHE